MQIHYTGRHMEVTPALKEYTEEKMERLNHRHANLTNINFTFHVEHLSHIAEGSLHAYNTDFHAKADASDMYAAIDLVIDKLLAQMTKHKEKMTDHHR
jgi:putative sigma-54 modulation protein